MTPDDYIGMIFDELKRAEHKFPGFPTDSIHAAAVLAEEVGELQQACLQWVYEGGSFERITEEAVQSAAMALRFLFNMESLRRRPSVLDERATEIIREKPDTVPPDCNQCIVFQDCRFSSGSLGCLRRRNA